MTRRDEILKLIVEHFVKTAEPVGSKTLLDSYHLNISSATIRNEMNALEQEGFLEKTHTSSGRVPSEKGYSYYVEHLRAGDVDEGAKYALQSVLDKKTKSVEEVIKESCEILSHMTNLASVVLGPGVQEEHLASVQVIPLGTNTATAVFVTDKGYVENKTFIIQETIKVDDVQRTVKLFNDRLTGTAISDLVPKMEAMKPALTDYVVGHEVFYQAIMEALVKFTGERLNFYGKDALFAQPEFANDADKLRQLLEFIDNPASLRKAVSDSRSTESGVAIHIGNKKEGTEDLALVSTGLNIPGDKGSSLSVLGPTRMDYEKVVSTLKYFAKALDDYFAAQTKGGHSACQKKTSPAKHRKKTNENPLSHK
jgi:heat-inducible transcriptional repressor